jgi:heme oxygenase (staphylobilin-producing)
LIDDKDPNVDVVRILIYWENKEAFYRFEGSPEHIAMHRDKKHTHHHIHEGLVDIKRESYQMLTSDVYEK